MFFRNTQADAEIELFNTLKYISHFLFHFKKNRKTKKGQRRKKQFIHKEGPKDTII
jgi:hypothetical protein